MLYILKKIIVEIYIFVYVLILINCVEFKKFVCVVGLIFIKNFYVMGVGFLKIDI